MHGARAAFVRVLARVSVCGCVGGCVCADSVLAGAADAHFCLTRVFVLSTVYTYMYACIYVYYIYILSVGRRMVAWLSVTPSAQTGDLVLPGQVHQLKLNPKP